MVEGGKFLLDAFIQSDRWDEIRLFKSNQRFEEGLQAPEFSGTLVDNQEFEDDILEIYEV